MNNVTTLKFINTFTNIEESTNELMEKPVELKDILI